MSASYKDADAVKASLRPSASPIFNNLAKSGGNLVFSHNRTVCVFAAMSVGQSAQIPVRRMETQKNEYIHMVSVIDIKDGPWTKPGHGTYVIVGTEGALEVWDQACTHLMHAWMLPADEQPSQDSTIPAFVRGSAAVIASDKKAVLCFGTSKGKIYTANILEGGRLEEPFASFTNHAAPITAIASAFHTGRGSWNAEMGTRFVSGDQEGLISIWDAQSASKLQLVSAISSSNVPVSSLGVKSGLIIAARVDGTVQMYDLATGGLVCELGSHSRGLVAMDIHPSMDMFATGAEDATVAIWSLPVKGKKIECLLSHNWMHAQVAGLAFCGEKNASLAVVAQDLEEMRLFPAKLS